MVEHLGSVDLLLLLAADGIRRSTSPRLSTIPSSARSTR